MRLTGIDVTLGLLGTVMAWTVPAFAEERVCRGRIGKVTVDNLRVPQHATCTLVGTRVKGTIKVQRRAKLEAVQVTVIGNLQAEGAARVIVRRSSRVGGSIQLEQGGSASILNSSVGGSIQLKENARLLRVVNTIVGSDIQAFQNRGGVEVRRNRVDGNLQCKSNRPAPVGGGNLVKGNKEDQCRRL
jgi:hypothetical protein